MYGVFRIVICDIYFYGKRFFNCILESSAGLPNIQFVTISAHSHQNNCQYFLFTLFVVVSLYLLFVLKDIVAPCFLNVCFCFVFNFDNKNCRNKCRRFSFIMSIFLFVHVFVQYQLVKCSMQNVD